MDNNFLNLRITVAMWLKAKYIILIKKISLLFSLSLSLSLPIADLFFSPYAAQPITLALYSSTHFFFTLLLSPRTEDSRVCWFGLGFHLDHLIPKFNQYWGFVSVISALIVSSIILVISVGYVSHCCC